MGPFFTTAVRRTYVNFAQMLLKSEASAKKKIKCKRLENVLEKYVKYITYTCIF